MDRAFRKHMTHQLPWEKFEGYEGGNTVATYAPPEVIFGYIEPKTRHIRELEGNNVIEAKVIYLTPDVKVAAQDRLTVEGHTRVVIRVDTYYHPGNTLHHYEVFV